MSDAIRIIAFIICSMTFNQAFHHQIHRRRRRRTRRRRRRRRRLLLAKTFFRHVAIPCLNSAFARIVVGNFCAKRCVVAARKSAARTSVGSTQRRECCVSSRAFEEIYCWPRVETNLFLWTPEDVLRRAILRTPKSTWQRPTTAPPRSCGKICRTTLL